MSHFTVSVRVPSSTDVNQLDSAVEKLLAPYQENNMGDCPQEYLEFKDTEAEHLEDYTSGGVCVLQLRLPDGSHDSPYNSIYRKDERWVYPEGSEVIRVPANEVFETFDEYMEVHQDMRRNEDGKYGYMRNPNAKWDWWMVGGRWTGFYPVAPELLEQDDAFKRGTPGLFTTPTFDNHVDACRIKHIDSESVRNTTQTRISHFWEAIKSYTKYGQKCYTEMRVLHELGAAYLTAKPKENPTTFLHPQPFPQDEPEYYVVKRSVVTKKEQLQEKLELYFHPLQTWAFLDPEKGWRESSNVGLFGSSSETTADLLDYLEEFVVWLHSGDDNDWLVIVDCHT